MSISSIVRRANRQWHGSGRARIAVFAVAAVIGLTLPVAVGSFFTSLLIRILIWATIATAFNFAFGFADLPSFGHAAFYGLAAYGLAMSLLYADAIPLVDEGIVLPILIGFVGATVAGVIIGFFALRGIGIYFALITFGFAEVIHQFIVKSKVTKGTDGIILQSPEVPFGLTLDLMTVYYLAFLVLAATLATHYWILNSPFGRVMQAIQSNDDRAEYVGYPVDRVKLVVFTLSAAYTAAGGVLFVLMNKFVGPSVAAAEVSINLLIITIIGGASFLMGPTVGAAFFILLNHFTRDLQHLGVIIVGVVFILVIMFMPQGIYGKVKEVWRGFAEE